MQQPENSKPFRCPKECGRSYSRLEHLNRHHRQPCKPREPNRHLHDSHTRHTKSVIHVTANDGQVHDVHRDGNWRYPCLYGCGKDFSRHDNLTRHMKFCSKRGTARVLSDSAGLSTAETANGSEPRNGDQSWQAGEHDGIRIIPADEYTQACIPF